MTQKKKNMKPSKIEQPYDTTFQKIRKQGKKKIYIYIYSTRKKKKKKKIYQPHVKILHDRKEENKYTKKKKKKK